MADNAKQRASGIVHKFQQHDPKVETGSCGLAHAIWPAQHF